MELNEYQDWTATTEYKDLSLKDARLAFALGLGEAGEIQNAVKKHIFHGHSFEETQQKVLDECGDAMWGIARILAKYGLTMEGCAQYNKKKLTERYPNGFDKQASINRKK